MKISKKKPFEWFLDNFGIGGTINYTEESILEIMEALLRILEHSGYVELEWIGKFLLQLSNSPEALERFCDDLKEYLAE
jgi:hypothetical protein